MKFVLLCSPAFSGSTLVGFLMNAHPQIVSIGEMTGLVEEVDPATFRCSCGALIDDCPFWQAIAAHMARQGFAFTVEDFATRLEWGGNKYLCRVRSGSLRSVPAEQLRDGLLGLSPRRDLRQRVARNEALALALAEVSGKLPVVFDTSKFRMRIRYLQRYAPQLDVHVVHLVRDVRGVVNSHLKHFDLPDVRHPTAHWVRFNRLMAQELDRLPPERKLIVRYEDLCLSTEETLARLYTFCGVEPLPEVELTASEHHILGNAMRLNGVGEIRLDEKWKTALSPEQIATIDRESAGIRAQYGYEDAH